MSNKIYKCKKSFKIPKFDDNFNVPENPRFITIKEGSKWEFGEPQEGYDVYLENLKTGSFLFLWKEDLEEHFVEVPNAKRP